MRGGTAAQRREERAQNRNTRTGAPTRQNSRSWLSQHVGSTPTMDMDAFEVRTPYIPMRFHVFTAVLYSYYCVLLCAFLQPAAAAHDTPMPWEHTTCAQRRFAKLAPHGAIAYQIGTISRVKCEPCILLYASSRIVTHRVSNSRGSVPSTSGGYNMIIQYSYSCV